MILITNHINISKQIVSNQLETKYILSINVDFIHKIPNKTYIPIHSIYKIIKKNLYVQPQKF